MERRISPNNINMEIRPRLSPKEYEVILAYRDGKITYNPKSESEHPKILLYDIETAPLSAYLFGIWQQNVNLDFLNADWFMLSWAAKWLDEEEIFSDVVTPDEATSENDKRICVSLWDMIDEADIVIGHNVDKFDVKKMNTRFLFHGLQKPSLYETIDTLKVLKKNFAITSNRLDYFNKWMGMEGKLHTDAKLWARCLKGEQEALDLMLEYNENDVIILERDYIKLRGWIDNHPNTNVYNNIEECQCANCGSESITWGGYKHTKVGKYKSYRCNHCGHVGHSRFNVLTTEKRKTILR